MRRCNHVARALLFALPITLLPEAGRADFVSGSDGSDGAFNPQFKTVTDLSLAATASWDTPSPVPGQGVYDPEQWAVVFKYTTIDIPAGVTVSFLNHPSGAPVVWLTPIRCTLRTSPRMAPSTLPTWLCCSALGEPAAEL